MAELLQVSESESNSGVFCVMLIFPRANFVELRGMGTGDGSC